MWGGKTKKGGANLRNYTNKSQRKTKSVSISISLFFLLVASLFAVFSVSASASEPVAPVLVQGRAYETAAVKVRLDGRAILEDQAVIIDSVTYVPVRRFSEIAGASSVSWNGNTRTATVKKGDLTVSIGEGKYYISANGRYFYTVEKILNLNGTLFVPIRPICKAFSIDVGWNASTRTVELTSTGKALQSGDSFYKSDEVYWLSRIINAEAGGEPFKGKIAVGNVVLNRVRSSSYPNTIYGVIFDRKNGTQFSPVVYGTIYNSPNQDSVIAAKLCLEGYSLSDSILFFMNPRIATNNWISKNRPFAFRIGNHDFYY